MKYLITVLLALAILIPQAATASEVVVPWFTDSAVVPDRSTFGSGSTVSGGTIGNCIHPTASLSYDLSQIPQILDKRQGVIEFWVKPDWAGSDTNRHQFIKIGDPTRNGILIERSPKGMLRFVMAGKDNGTDSKVTVVRSDVKNWKKNEWHHVACAWSSLENKPLGISLWIDHIMVESIIYGGDEFMDWTTLSTANKKLWIGDSTTQACIDELVLRGDTKGYLRRDEKTTIWRDYFMSAPYDRIEIDSNPLPNGLKADPRIIEGFIKQFGVKARRSDTHKYEKVTNYDEGYTQWGAFDAKPFLHFDLLGTAKATVDDNPKSYTRGLVTAIKPESSATNDGQTFNIRVEWQRGVTLVSDPLPVTIVSSDKPDLDIMYVERYPKYSDDGKSKWVYGGSTSNTENAQGQKWPKTNEVVTSVIHYGNFGYAATNKPCILKFEVRKDVNKDFVYEPKIDNIAISTKVDGSIASSVNIPASFEPGAKNTQAFTWVWPGLDVPVFVIVTIDPADTAHPNNNIDEICETNNRRCELSTSQAVRWGYQQADFDKTYKNKIVNMIGSFSPYDYTNSYVDACDGYMRSAIYRTTSPNGMHASIRMDNYYPLLYSNGGFLIDGDREPFWLDGKYYDGEWSWTPGEIDKPRAITAGTIHELGHRTLGAWDTYSDMIFAQNIYLADSQGKSYANTKLFPRVKSTGEAQFWNVFCGRHDEIECGWGPCWGGNCGLWFDEFNAGMTPFYGSKRPKGARPEFNLFMPAKNRILVLDKDDEPLKNAVLYVYQQSDEYWGYCANTRYVPNNAKFIGKTDNKGSWTFPATTEPNWDDPKTDIIEGAYTYPNNNPFWQPSKSGDYDTGLGLVHSIFIIKVVSGAKEEFKILPAIDFYSALFANGGDTRKSGLYILKTSLLDGGDTKKLDQVMASGNNYAPVATVVATEMTVASGQEFTIDATPSKDPEGQPLHYMWLIDKGDWRDFDLIQQDTPALTQTAYKDPERRRYGYEDLPAGDMWYRLIVTDGVRVSEAVRIKVHIKSSGTK